VGLPAKSGVAGGILLVVPNVMGMMCWSPPLDKMGNSVKGIHFCHHSFGPLDYESLQQELALKETVWKKVSPESNEDISTTVDLVSLCNFHNYDNLRHFAKKLDPRREGGDQR
ncbi:hypothetical protein Celaphus_00015974, partial [Cervus elaphus hippelaphus]